MATSHRIISFAALLTLTACGGGGGEGESSGLDPSSQVLSLSATEGESLCSWAAEVQGGAGTVHECGDGVTIEVQTVAECTTSFSELSSCDLTVAQFEDCSLALAESPCSFGGSACAPLFECL